MTTYGIGRAPCGCAYCTTAREVWVKAHPKRQPCDCPYCTAKEKEELTDRRNTTERRERDDEAQA